MNTMAKAAKANNAKTLNFLFKNTAHYVAIPVPTQQT
jgi:hypothetical protein